jgi:signal transduction histidine kinase
VKGTFTEDRSRTQQVRKLTEVSRAITYAASLEEVFQLTVDRALELVAATQSLLMVASDDGSLTVRCSRGIDAALVRSFHEPLTEALVPRLARLLDARPENFLGVPLVVAGAIKGILVVIRPPPSAGGQDEEWLLSALADQAAIALEKTGLDEIAEFREQLIGIVGHDLRNPLGTILMAARLLLQRQGLGEKETELARRITSSASRAARLIDQLLDLTRSRLGGGIPIDPAPLDLHDVCQQVIGETELAHPDRPLRVELQGDLTGVWDRDRLYQLLDNLVGNAVQHGEARSPIGLRIEGKPTEVIIEIANRATPIAPAMMPFIFDAFRRGRPEQHASRAQGLGLGLFIAQQIARSHAGSIAATSSERDGTTFRIRLPRGTARPSPG